MPTSIVTPTVIVGGTGECSLFSISFSSLEGVLHQYPREELAFGLKCLNYICKKTEQGKGDKKKKKTPRKTPAVYVG